MQDDKDKGKKKAKENESNAKSSAMYLLNQGLAKTNPSEVKRALANSNKEAKNYVRDFVGTPDKYLGRDYPLSPTPKMEISPLDGKIKRNPISSIKKNK